MTMHFGTFDIGLKVEFSAVRA